MMKRNLKVHILLCLFAMLLCGRVSTAANYAGSGTAQDPYRIQTVQDLLDIKEAPAAHYILVNSIDLQNIQLSDFFANEFSGVFNGNGHTISNYNGQGLFDINKGVIKNIKIQNAVVNRNSMEGTGLIAGTNRYNGIIQGCDVSNVSINRASGSGNIGGIVGNNFGLVENCNISGKISGGGTRGGIAGYVSNDYTLIGTGSMELSDSRTIRNCTSNMELDGLGATGGIVGFSTGYVNIVSCKVDGTIKIKGAIVGGIIGTATIVNVKDCNINATFTGTSETTVGGVIGRLETSGGASVESMVSNCKVESNMTLKSLNAKTVALGGIIGQFNGFGNNKITIDQCSYNGKMSILVLNNAFVGGIIGRTNNEMCKRLTIANCTTKGSIVPNTDVNHSYTVIGGGIIGYAQNLKVTQCISTMNVTGNYAGGIMGQAEDNVSIDISSASGAVVIPTKSSAKARVASRAGGGYAGGIVGSFSGAKIQRSYFDVVKTKQTKATGITLNGKVQAVGYKSASFDQKTYEIGANKKVTLGKKLDPTSLSKKPIKYTSANTLIATVTAKGVVTGKKAGTTTITATVDNLITFSCKVVIQDNIKARTPSLSVKKKGKDRFVLTWKRVNEADQYVIEKYDAKTKKYKVIKKVSASTLTYTDKKMKKDTVYQYRIRATKKVAGKVVNSKTSTVKKKFV